MLRINRHSGRRGCDGVYRTWEVIEAEYRKEFEGTIDTALCKLIDDVAESERCKEFYKYCKGQLKDWICAKPDVLLRCIEDEEGIKNEYKVLSTEKEHAKEKIKAAFGYTNKRARLSILAGWLDLKTCPYCNMQYTLHAVEKEEGGKRKEMAVFQFDHFIPQSEYPMFSMSLYNLVPSCASCNRAKGDDIFDLDYHPYYSDIKNKLRFRVKDPLPLLVGRERDIEIEVEHPNDDEWKKYEAATHVEALYKRHQDIAREVFARAYSEAYYENKDNFGFLGKDKVLVERMRRGFYPDEDDIDKRPLTKLQQDLWEQAKKLYKYTKNIEYCE